MKQFHTARPPRNRSINHPPMITPRHPAGFEPCHHPTRHMGLDVLDLQQQGRSPSNMTNRTVYTKKLAVETSQMYLLRKTCFLTKALNSSRDCSCGPAVRVPATSGKPTDGGVSGAASQINTAEVRTMAKGTKKQARQPYTTR